jgi:hypothetical protein
VDCLFVTDCALLTDNPLVSPTIREFPRALWLHQTFFIHQYRRLHHLIIVFPHSTLCVASFFPLLSRRRLTDGFPSISRRLHSALPTIQPRCWYWSFDTAFGVFRLRNGGNVTPLSYLGTRSLTCTYIPPLSVYRAEHFRLPDSPRHLPLSRYLACMSPFTSSLLTFLFWTIVSRYAAPSPWLLSILLCVRVPQFRSNSLHLCSVVWVTLLCTF